MSDHESLVNVPVQLLGTVGYLKTTRIMKSFARLMKDRKHEQKFAVLERKLKAQLKKNYWGKGTSLKLIEQQSREASLTYINNLPDGEREAALANLEKTGASYNRQTYYALMLYSEVIPEDERAAAVDSLLQALDRAPAGHFTTGIFGTKYVLEILSRYGHADRVLEIVNSTEFPGWGYMISKGATTQWETWKESDDIYSNCHPMFGSVSAWFYRWVAGIQPVSPGFSDILITPLTHPQLPSLDASYQTPRGPVRLRWEQKGERVIYDITIPRGSKAVFRLPSKKKNNLVVRKAGTTRDYAPLLTGSEANEFRLSPGQYSITAE
ncbi:MAG: hypothetical protein EOP49_38895 [Sphingobacteriales bacterium]|nr:MAG: hypothetical protein EOP49_38895 [Sphingobacteriales bacterium]